MAGDCAAPREDQERGQHEDDRRIGELLQRIERVEGARGRLPEGRIGDELVPGGGEDIPGGGDEPRPFAGGEQQDRVEHPEERGAEMPMPPHAQVVAPRLPQPRRNSLFHIQRGPEPILRHHFLGEFEPLRPRRTMHVPVQPGVRPQNLEAGADQEPDEEHVDPVGGPYPDGEAKCRVGHRSDPSPAVPCAAVTTAQRTMASLWRVSRAP